MDNIEILMLPLLYILKPIHQFKINCTQIVFATFSSASILNEIRDESEDCLSGVFCREFRSPKGFPSVTRVFHSISRVPHGMRLMNRE